MESGLAAKERISDGWLNRALALMRAGDRRIGLAVGGAVPLILRGAVPVASWEPAGGLRDASPEFLSALKQGAHGRIAITYFEWAGIADKDALESFSIKLKHSRSF